MKFLEAYNDYLSKNSNIVHGFLFFVLCNVVAWFILFKYRERIIKGLEGENQLFQAGEIVIFISLWCMPPVLFYIVFFTPQYLYGLYFVGGIVCYALMGRYIFDWALAFKNGKSEVTQIVDPEPKVKVTTTTETVTK